MDLNNHKLLKRQNYDNIGEAEEDRISELPDSLLHGILSFLQTKFVARTSVLSKRWNNIWTSMHTLDFPSWNHSTSSSEINKFMDFVDRTLLFHHASDIQKMSLYTNTHFNASRVHSWISIITRCNVKELTLYLHLDEPFFVPVSLFTCASLTKLELKASSTIHLPKSFSFPKLKSLTFDGIQFTDDCSWNKQTLSDCPVLENLDLRNCTWFGVRNFCISTPALKVLQIRNYSSEGDGLYKCALKICAPNLVSLVYNGSVAKDYDLYSFVTLEIAEIYFDECDEKRRKWLRYGAAASKLFRALSDVKRLELDAASLQVLSKKDDFTNKLPTFHNLNKLDLCNLKELRFQDCTLFSIEDEKEYDEMEGLFRNLQSVYFGEFIGDKKDFRLAELILKNAESLQMMTISFDYFAKNKEIVMSELSSLPRASRRCVFEVV